MDFRQSDPEVPENEDPENDLGVWRVPSFLYVLPVDKDTVFIEETCLVARVQVPFDELKRRLYRRLSRMGLSVEKENIVEEEASWIPLGGTPPVSPQRTLAYGAAAGLVHPASGYSIVNSLRRAPKFAEAVVSGLEANGSVGAAEQGWDVLWGDEQRRQVSSRTGGKYTPNLKTLNPNLHTLTSISQYLNPKPYSPKPETLNPKPRTLNLEPQTLSPKPQTPNP